MTKKKAPAIHPALVLGTGILVVSTASIMIRYAQAEAGSLVIAAARLAIATLVLTPAILRGRIDELRRLERRDLLLAGVSGAFLAVHFATWISSLQFTTVLSSIVLVQSTPLWVALLAPLLLREGIGPGVVLGLSLALLGGTLVTVGDGCTLDGLHLACPPVGELLKGNSGLGNFLALSGAWAAAGYILIGRNLRSRLSLVTYVYLVYGVAALFLVLSLVVTRQPVAGFSPLTYMWLVLIALGPQLIGHSSFNWALGYLPASFVSITFLGESVGAAVLAVLLLGETPTVVKLIGAGMILAGIYMASRPAAAGGAETKDSPVIPD